MAMAENLDAPVRAAEQATWVPSMGAWPGPHGTHFRVWAPEASRVEVVAERPDSRARAFALAKAEDGTFRGHVAEVRPGDRYRYRVDGKGPFPDPASRFQPEGVHGPSEVVDPSRFAWTDQGWPGVPPEEVVIYELHVGTFTPEGTFAGATCPPAGAGRPRRHGHRADAAGRLRGRPELGLRRRRPLRPGALLRDARRPADARGSGPSPRDGGLPGRRLQPLRAGGELHRSNSARTTSRRRAAPGPPASTSTGRKRDGPRVLRRECAALGPRIPHRRPPPRRDPRPLRRGPPPLPRGALDAGPRVDARPSRPADRRGPSQPRARCSAPSGPAAGTSTASGPTTSTTRSRRLVAGDHEGYYRDYTGHDRRAGRDPQPGLVLHRPAVDPPRRAEGDRPHRDRAPAVRHLPPEPRPGRQPRLRRPPAPHHRTRRLPRGDGAPAGLAADADAVHGAGMGLDGPLPVFHRPRRGPRQDRDRGPSPRVPPLPRLRGPRGPRDDPRPAGRLDLREEPPRLVGARPRAARLDPPPASGPAAPPTLRARPARERRRGLRGGRAGGERPGLAPGWRRMAPPCWRSSASGARARSRSRSAT